jgi:transmembrane protein EpsG
MWELLPAVSICMVLAMISDRLSLRDKFRTAYEMKEKYLWIVISVVLVVFAGLRTHYNDTNTYLESYIYLINSNFDFSEIDWFNLGYNPGFNTFTIFCKSIGLTNNGFLLVSAALTYPIFIWFLRKYSNNFQFSVFLFICLVVVFPLAAIKQSMAMAFCAVGVDRAINKKWARFVFWILIAELFHAFAIMYLFVPFLFFIPWKSAKSYIWLVVFFISAVLLRPFLGVLLETTESLGKGYSVEALSGEGVHPLRVVVCLMPLFLSFFIRESFIRDNNDFDRVDGLFLNLCFLNGGIMFIALFGTANYFARLANYFILFQCISIPRLLDIARGKWHRLLIIIAVICYIIFFWYSNCVANGVTFDLLFNRISIFDFKMFE